MSLSPELLAQLYCQDSDDPFLALITLSHSSFVSDIRLVNNQENVTSRGLVYTAFPVNIKLPADDGETSRSVSLDFDNVGLSLIGPIRTVTSPISVKIEYILASLPNAVQIEVGELKIQTISYNKSRISATLVVDNFLTAALTSEKYTPTNFPGIF